MTTHFSSLARIKQLSTQAGIGCARSFRRVGSRRPNKRDTTFICREMKPAAAAKTSEYTGDVAATSDVY